MARIAASLTVLRDQVDTGYPNRRKRNDGWIGDDAHKTRDSDHNPNRHGVVTALDLTHDPANGFDSYAFADTLKATRDPRIKYLISNRRISNPSKQNGAWRDYDGDDPHTGHIHISVSADPALYDDSSTWDLSTSDTLSGRRQLQGQRSGKGSWYSQYSGTYNWVDPGDEPGSSALRVPDSAQGCALYNQSTLGDWFVVTAPNGRSLLMPQTDIGPHPNTGRKIDIAAHMAEAFGYTPRNFPTDGIFKWVPAAPPVGLEHLTPKQQAIEWARSDPQEEPDDRPDRPDDMPDRPDDTLNKPQPNGNPLLLILLLILSKGKLMAGDPAKPRQGVDIEKVLLPLLLQSALTGKLIDINELLSVALTGQPSTSAPNALMPTVWRGPLQQPTDTNAMLPPLFYQMLTGKPWPGQTPPDELGDSKETMNKRETPVTSRPSVQLSVAGLALSTILQALGIVGTPFGMGQSPTETGTLATLLPFATAAIGATGGFGALASIGLRLLSGFRR
jgi:hypothetical protein